MSKLCTVRYKASLLCHHALCKDSLGTLDQQDMPSISYVLLLLHRRPNAYKVQFIIK